MTSKKTKIERKLMGQRVSVELLARIERLAEKQKRSPRQILEFVIERGLPPIEKEAGIDPDTKA